MKKIYIAHSSSYNFVEELYTPLRASLLETQFDIILPHENGTELHTKDIIKETDLMIAEVTYPSTGQGIELGWADMLQTPLLCIYKEDKGIASSSLKKITKNIISYSDTEDMIKQLDTFLKKFFTSGQ